MFKIGDKVEVRNWHTPTADNDRTYPLAWRSGTVKGFDRNGNPWVVYEGYYGNTEVAYFLPWDVRLAEDALCFRPMPC